MNVPSLALSRLLRQLTRNRSFQSSHSSWSVTEPSFKPRPRVCRQCMHSLATQRTLHTRPARRILQRGHGIRQASSDAEQDEAKARAAEDLPSRQESRRSTTSKRFSHLMDNVTANIFVAGQRLNDLTGYSGIEGMKRDIQQQGTQPVRVTTLGRDLTHTYRTRRRISPGRPPRSQGSLHDSNLVPVRLSARGERAPAAQACLVTL